MGAMPLCGDWLSRSDICVTIDGEPPAPALVARAIDSATSWMYESTNQLFSGVCTSVVRPKLPCGHPDPCACRAGWRKLDLSPFVPGTIQGILAVDVNGETLENAEEADYRLAWGRYLVPHEGGGLWPWPAQHLNRPDGADGTWSVTVTHGNPPPPHVADAAAELARQLILRGCSSDDCLLPDNATSVTRDGVTVEFNIPTGGKTGIPTVDTIIDLYPAKRVRRMYDPAAIQGDSRRLPGV